ncbi:tyrosine-protein phosphatase [Sphingomonas sp. DT-207]|uniref:tyrosine-protein phosphatase n=1 Tax=Sphingomonas sp. DT-207 TaxID=3396167 RepID=UPI003F1D41F9
MKRSITILAALAASALVLPAASVGQQARPAQSAVQHQRVLPLEGGQNFRDLGGYRTADGRTVKWGVLFRSGAMNGLTDKDFAYLRKLGLRTVCDFRDIRERKQAAVNWPAGTPPKVLASDYSMDSAEMMRTLAAPGLDGPKTRTMMASFYRETPYKFADQYRRMFGELKAGNVPLAFNCSAGKDRTGVAAALLLTALGVPHETVVEDYLLSNTYFKPTAAMAGDDEASAFFKRLPPDVIKALMGVDRSYIEGAFAEIRERSGSLDAYYKDELGLSAADIAALRARYLEKAR